MREIIKLNTDWEFCGDKNADLRKKKLPKKCIVEKVNIPHTVMKLSDGEGTVAEGKYYYRKKIDIPFDASKKYVLEFEGVMQIATLYINAKKVHTHYGGYVDFAVDVTAYLNRKSSDNAIVVCVDTSSDRDVPVGKESDDIDFMYYGGIYRNVKLIINDSVHITNPLLPASTCKDGVYIFTRSLNDTAQVDVNVKVENSSKSSKNVKAAVRVFDFNGREAGVFESGEYRLKKGSAIMLTAKVEHNEPKLWSPSYPYLYTYAISVMSDGEIVDEETVKRGLRKAEIDHRGFVLNGKKIYLRGVLRHDQMPIIGNAISDEMEYRDAFKIKSAGFNLVKTGFYPTSKAFIKACDELGLMVLNTAPGYQHMERGGFSDLLADNVKFLSRRDRNSTSVVLWQATPAQTSDINSQGATDKFFARLNNAIAVEIYGEKPLTTGDSVGRKDLKSVGYDAPYCVTDSITKKRTLDYSGRKGIVSDYGDYEFGYGLSTSRVSRDDEGAMLLQAWNMQWQHNQNRGNAAVTGDILSEAFDHNSALNKGVVTGGIMDAYRLPKFSYRFFTSQDNRKGAKNVFIPTFWDDDKINKIVVYGNCDSVKLYINGVFIEERTPDSGETHDYTPLRKKEARTAEKIALRAAKKGVGIEGRHWALKAGMELNAAKLSPLVLHSVNTMYTGGDCEYLEFPPFTFDSIEYAAGEIKAVGYVDGKAAAEHSVKTPLQASSIRLRADYSNKALNNDGTDTIFVYAEITDEFGTVVRSFDNEITFSSVNGSIISGPVVKPIAGVAAIMIKSDYGADKIEVTAGADGINGCVIKLRLNKTVTAAIADKDDSLDTSDENIDTVTEAIES